MGRGRSGEETERARGRGETRRRGHRARELSDNGFQAVFGSGRGAHFSSALLDRGELSAEALARRERLRDAGGIAGVLSRAKLRGGDIAEDPLLRDELADVADELCDDALGEGAALRAHLARLLGVTAVAELSRQRFIFDVHRSVMRNCVRHDEASLRQRTMLSHDKLLGARIESHVMRDGHGDWLALTVEEERGVVHRVLGAQSGAPPVRAPWKTFVAKLRAAGDVERMSRADIRLLFVEHAEAEFALAVARRRRRR